MKKNNKAKTILFLALVLVAIAGICLLSGFGIGKNSRGSAKNIILGLDLKGGVSITYEAKEKNPGAKELNDTIYKLQRRVSIFSTESDVYSTGTNKITVDIPGVSNVEEITNTLGKPGTLYFASLYTETTEDTKANEDTDKEAADKKDADSKDKAADSKDKDADSKENAADDKANTESADASKDNAQAEAVEPEYTSDGYEIKEIGGTKYKIWLTGQEVQNAQGTTRTDDQSKKSEDVVELTMTNKGAKAFQEATTECEGQIIYILYDDEIISAPRVKTVINNGEAIIDGMESLEAAENLAAQIRIGSLDLELEQTSSKVVGARLGQDAIKTSLTAGLVGFILVALFMILVYRLPGLAAAISLVAYTGIVLVSLNAFDMTLTLPGIAGIILGIGMAVDANVIIYARIREELATGKTVKSAISIGFKKASSAIIDGNITTLIASLVLMWKGTGPVQGFAQTLALGILVSMFTAMVVSRLVVVLFYNLGLTNEKLYGTQKERKVIDFLKYRFVFFIISLIVVIGGIAVMFISESDLIPSKKNLLNYSVEFIGGTSYDVEFDKEYTINDFESKIKPALEKIINDSDIQGNIDVDNAKSMTLKMKELTSEQDDAVRKALTEQFGAIEGNIQADTISASVSDNMKSDAILAVALATICMLIYIWLRFKNIRFATSAIIALLHDVLFLLAFYSISWTSIGNTFIACMLTILGYSINATIVIFDRIRENLKEAKRNADLKELVNQSITQTLTRSIYTTLTTVIMVLLLYIMGVSAMREFALPLLVGMLAGAYSSVCITGALWYEMMTRFQSKKKNK